MKRSIIYLMCLVFVAMLASASQNVKDYLPVNNKKPYKTRNLKNLKGIVIHHSAGNGMLLKEIAEFHISKGWGGFAYHFAISKNGTIFQTQNLDVISYQASGNNRRSIGIVMLGNYEFDEPTDESVASLEALVESLEMVHEMEWIKYHGQLKNTACPGVNMIPKIQHLLK